MSQYSIESLFLKSGSETLGVDFYRPHKVRKPPVIIMAHGFAGERKFSLPDTAATFANTGYAVILFDYRGFGTENTAYYGQPRMVLYYRHTNNMYWGNPFYRAEYYVQNKLYWNFIDNDYVRGQIAARTHLSEGKFYFEQMLTLSAHINNYHPKKVKREPTFWERVFPRRGRASDGIEM